MNPVETPREKANKNLVPFKPGADDRRGKGRGAPRKIDDEKLELFAKAVAEGLTAAELAEEFDVGLTTVKTYKKDPRVKAIALKHVEERILRICRKTDQVIEERLRHVDEMDTETILRIRKEFLGGAMRIQTQGGDAKDDKTITETMMKIEESPELIEKLAELLESD